MRTLTTSLLCLLVLGCGSPELDKAMCKATATGPLTASARKTAFGVVALRAAAAAAERERPAQAEPRPAPVVERAATREPERVATVVPAPRPAPAPTPVAAATPASAPATVAVAAPDPAPAPAPAPVAAPAPAEVAEAPPAPSEVVLARMIVARSIENREPVGEAPFDGDVDELYVFLDARNDGAPATLAVRWDAPDGTPGRPIDLEVPTARRWRTWATTNRVRGRSGVWTVVITDASGREVARQAFTVEPPSAS